MKIFERTCILATCMLVAFPHEAVPALTRIGAAGGVSGQVLAMAPDSGEGVKAGVGRVLSSGKTVYHNDKISTDDKGRLQVLLLDETVFTIGPNSEMYIDEFVFDPSGAGGNKVTARVTKGVFRFVTGKIGAKEPSAMKVKLPVGTIGIRGTIAGGSISDQGTMIALLGPGASNDAGEKPGAVDVATSGGAVTISAPGFATTITGGGEAPPTTPAPLTAEQQQQLSTAPPPPSDDGSGGGGGQAASGQESGGGESATEAAASDSAQTQSAGAASALTSADLTAFQTETSVASQNAAAAASSIADGIAQWTDFATQPTGSGHYTVTNAPWVCQTCNSGSTGVGQVSYTVGIDFGSKTIGTDSHGCTTSISMSGVQSGSTNIIGSVPFGAAGDAVATFTASQLSNSAFDGTTFTLINLNGVPAHHGALGIRFNTNSTYSPVPSGTFVVEAGGQ